MLFMAGRQTTFFFDRSSLERVSFVEEADGVSTRCPIGQFKSAYLRPFLGQTGKMYATDFRGWWGRLCSLRAVKIQTNEIQMKFCRGRDGLVLVRFARPSKRKQGQISRQIFKQLVAPHATPCLNAKCWMIRFIPFEYDRILLPSCTSNLQIEHNLRRRVRKYRNN